MKSLIKRIIKKSSQKNNDNIYSMCNNPNSELSSYCALEYTYINKKSN
jgi:hypothetical protein